MKRKFLPALLLSLALCALLTAAQAAGYELSAEKTSLAVKKSLTIRVLLDGESVDARTLQWESSDPLVLSIDKSGRARALKAGTATLTAAAPDGRSASLSLTVTQPVTALRTESSRLTLSAGEDAPFRVEILPADATDTSLVYSSSNEKVAVVDENGQIHALKAGKAKLTATAESGKRVRVTLTVVQPVTEIRLQEAEQTLSVGRTLTLQPTLLPADATAKKLTYTSSDPSVAAVNSRGRVTGKQPGQATITLTAESGAKTACLVRVVQPVRAVKAEKSRLTLSVGDRQQPSFTVSPANATDKALSYASGNPSVLSVDEATGQMTALKAGTATLTARSANGKSAQVRVTVQQPVTAVRVSSPGLTLSRGDSLRLSAEVEPSDATDKRLAYASSDKSVATVSSSGTVKAKKAGECVLTLTAKSGESAQVRLTVTQPVTRVTFGFNRKTVGKHETVALSPVLLPADATETALVWTSSNPAVARVTPQGELTGLKAGEATITARAESGKKASFRLTVKEIPLTGLRLERLYLSLTPGQQGEVGASVLPANATEQRITYESSAPDVAAVDEGGRVTALSLGEATITARTAGESPFTRTCRVVVADEPVLRLAGVTIGLNAGHQTRTNATPIPIAPGARETVKSIKVGSAGVVTRTPEYEINLQVALRLQALLEAEGARVVMVRTANEVNLSNIERANIMNEAQCDLALQIHCNGSQNQSRTGFSIYAQQLGSVAPRSQQIARQMLPTILEITGANDAGCHVSASYASLNWSSVPSVLLEMGYLSNPDEDRRLASADYQDLLAQAICESLCESLAGAG